VAARPEVIMEFFGLTWDFVGLIVAAVVLAMMGDRVSEGWIKARQLGGLLAALSFLGYLYFAHVEQMLDSSEAVAIVARGVAVAGVVLGASRILLVTLSWLYAHSVGALFAWARGRLLERKLRKTAERADEAEAERLHRQRTPFSPPITPPTSEELVVQAKARYEAMVRMLEAAGLNELELDSGRARAKQRYLRDIEEAMK
jgi:hypothetical protein